MFNAMTYTDVRNFALSLLQEVTEKKTSMKVQRVGRQAYDDEELSLKVAKALSGLVKIPKKIQRDLDDEEIEKINRQQNCHNIVVIDEVDQFNSSEKSFTTLVNTILRSKQFSETNTSIIGIANQVDLPFKKKHSAIAMRNCQLLFKPYSIEQITDILESKVNGRYSSLPNQVRHNSELKSYFFNLIDDRAYELIAKKVAKQNGDIRVAFDLFKSALDMLRNRIQKQAESGERVDLERMRVTYQIILEVFEQKDSGKSPFRTLKS